MLAYGDDPGAHWKNQVHLLFTSGSSIYTEHNGLFSKQIKSTLCSSLFLPGNYIYNLYKYNVHAGGRNSLLKEHPKSTTREWCRFAINRNNIRHSNMKETC